MTIEGEMSAAPCMVLRCAAAAETIWQQGTEWHNLIEWAVCAEHATRLREGEPHGSEYSSDHMHRWLTLGDDFQVGSSGLVTNVSAERSADMDAQFGQGIVRITLMRASGDSVYELPLATARSLRRTLDLFVPAEEDPPVG